MVEASRPKVVVIGAGFSGLWAARALAGKAVDVLVMDHNNYHSFLPLLYQVAAAELEPEDIIYPVRSILHSYPNIVFRLGEVVKLDFHSKRVKIPTASLSYDYLILAIGSTYHYFGISGASQYAFPLKTLAQAVSLRNHILCQFEKALYEPDPAHRQSQLTFIVVGGGPTGVEYTGALTELVHHPLQRDYPGLDFSQVRIMLIEATDRLLTGLPEKLHTYAIHRLERMGAEVKLSSPVSQITSDSVILEDGREIPAQTVIWTAGVRAESLPQGWDLLTAVNGQVRVMPTLQLVDHPEVYVAGDMAHVEQDGHPLPLIAPVAIQEGEWAAINILRQVHGEKAQPFHYHDPGMMITIGRNAAAVQLGRYSFTGFPAWVIWLSVHLFRLIGFRNRLLVLINWAWDYLFFERVVRLILPVPDDGSREKEIE